MKRWTTNGDGIDALSLDAEAATPNPSADELLVEVRAWSLNYRDLLVINGVDGWRPASPVVPISDAVGVVVAKGDRVDRFDVGDRVSAAFLPQWRSGSLTPASYTRPTGGPVNRGMLADLVTIDQHEAVRAPASLSDAQAATLPIAGVTAWHAVVRRSGVVAGDTVLIHGTGGVSLFAAQFSLAIGARVVITSGSDEKLRTVGRLGPVTGVNYRSDHVGDAVRDLTDGAGADHVIETVGGENLNVSLDAVRLGGDIAFVGLLEGLSAPVNTYQFVTKNVTIHGIETGSHEMYDEMATFVDRHDLQPVIDSVHPVESVAGALHHVAAGRHLGKVVVLPEV